MEAVNGTTKTVSYEREEICTNCKGSKNVYTTCKKCNGSGVKPTRRRNISMISPCPECKGSGQIRKESNCRYNSII